ncbi:MAG: type II toxin-antitoxin system RelE/ParE family toxin [Alteraurantiacibacter sp.]
MIDASRMLEDVYRPRGIETLDTIADYPIARWGAAQARKNFDDIRRQIEFAAEYSGIGNDTYGLLPKNRKMESDLPRIIYRACETELTVVSLTTCAKPCQTICQTLILTFGFDPHSV